MKNRSHDHLTAEGLLYLEAQVIMQAAMLAVMVVQWSQWCVYIDAICGVCTKNLMCLCIEFSIEHRAEIFSENNLISLEKIYSFPLKLPLVTLKCCCSPGRLGKQIKFLTSLFTWSTKFLPFFKLGARCMAKTRPCLSAYCVFCYEQ